jgi:hypothetical protein
MEHRRWSADDLVKLNSRVSRSADCGRAGERPVGNEGESSRAVRSLRKLRAQKRLRRVQLDEVGFSQPTLAFLLVA